MMSAAVMEGDRDVRHDAPQASVDERAIHPADEAFGRSASQALFIADDW
jgi:hypothetical protein